MMLGRVCWLRRGDGRAVRRIMAGIAATGMLVPLTVTGAAQAATVNPGTSAVSWRAICATTAAAVSANKACHGEPCRRGRRNCGAGPVR
jgi:hypothetical protein